VTAVSAPPREAPFHPAGFRHLWDLAARWNETWRNRAAGAELAHALRQIEAARTSGPDVLVAGVHGGSVPELRQAVLLEAVLLEAEALWGENAKLEVESVGTVYTALNTRAGRFNADVRVRCLNYEEIDRDRDRGCLK
jgi:hypothetical protein